jgi:hypothetical protein
MRVATLKRRYADLGTRTRDLYSVFEMLKSRPEADATAILQRIRGGEDLEGTLAAITDANLLVQMPETATEQTQSVEAMLNAQHPNVYPTLSSRPENSVKRGIPRKSMPNRTAVRDIVTQAEYVVPVLKYVLVIS